MLWHNEKFEGFCEDLIRKIAEKADFDYQLYLSPDGMYGTVIDGHMNGMLGEVESKVSYLFVD